MIENYFKIAWRNLVKNKIYSAINIFGLAIGLAVCMLIVLYIGHEYSYDKFHNNAKRIFFVKSKIKIGNDSVYVTTLPHSVAPSLQESEPSIESFLRLMQEREVIIQNVENPSLKFAEDRFMFADSNFFSFFSFKLAQGNKDRVLNHPFSVVISREASRKYFRDQNAVGKVIRFNNKFDFVITGVAGNPPSNSSIGYDFVASLSSLAAIAASEDGRTSEESRFATYFLLRDPKNIGRVEDGLMELERTKSKPIGRYLGIPLTRIRISEGVDTSNTRYLGIFPLVAGLILFLALINYMSLSTARSAIRAKEIGVRKVLGAGRKIIAGQFFAESALYASIAFVLGYNLCVLLQPLFFNFLQINIDASFLYSRFILLSYAVLFVITVGLAAVYPSIYLSAFKPVAVLYGKLAKHSGGISVRRFFTFFQFTVSVILIVCAIVINKQLIFFRETDTGINREQVIMIPFTPAAAKHYDVLKKEISSLPGVSSTSTALYPLYKNYDIMGTKSISSNQLVLLPTLSVDQNFISLFGLKWKRKPADSLFFHDEHAVILNETALQKLSLDQDPVGKKMDEELTVAGVLKDFNYAALHNKIDGLCVFVTADSDTASLWVKNGGCLYVKVGKHAHIPGFISNAKTIYEKYDNNNAFTYHFLDDAFGAMYKAEDRLLKILTAFTAFAILIACLGLFGLATFTVLQRTKEVGVRKVLGASVSQVTLLLSKDYISSVLIAVVVASPVAWWMMDKWLVAFAYRTNIEWWVFVAAGVLALLVALATVSFQSVKAAIANPVKSLRAE